MNFIEATDYARSGFQVRRKSWEDSKCSVTKRTDDGYLHQDTTKGFTYMVFTPSIKDIEAEDWRVDED